MHIIPNKNIVLKFYVSHFWVATLSLGTFAINYIVSGAAVGVPTTAPVGHSPYWLYLFYTFEKLTTVLNSYQVFNSNFLKFIQVQPIANTIK